jgi:tetratricopeptide (TPR) repeat protein
LRSLLSLVCILLFMALAFAADPAPLQGIFAEANARYQAGDFEGAERLYRQLADSGVDSGTVFYNLGNASFKLNKLGEAIYWWEKARARMPGDEDIRENLDFAGLMVVDRIEVSPDPFPVRVVDRALHFFPIGREIALALIFFIGANVLFAFYLVARSPAFSSRAFLGAAVAALLALIFAASAGWKLYAEEHRREGIVVEQKTDVRSGPGNDNITVVTVHEGTRFKVRGEANGWVQISLPNGWSGWLPRNSVRIL